MVGAFQTVDAQVGGGVLYGQVLHYLHAEIGPALVDPTPGTDSGHLFAAGCAITELVGWMAHDAGRDDRARAHFDRAFRLASAADHLPLAANVCASMAHLAGQLGEPGEAIRIAGAGLDRARPTGLRRLAARLQAMRARGLAMQGRRRECSANLHAAAASLEAADDETAPEWVAPFDAGSLAAETALCLAELGELAEAERHARQVIVLRTPARARVRAAHTGPGAAGGRPGRGGHRAGQRGLRGAPGAEFGAGRAALRPVGGRPGAAPPSPGSRGLPRHAGHHPQH